MRFGVQLVLPILALSVPAQAVTFTGVLNPVDGFAVFNFPWEPDPGFEFDEGKTQVSFSINNGVIYEANVSTHGHYSYDVIPSNPNAAPWGNDASWDEACFFNTSFPEGCHNISYNFPSEQGGAFFMSGLSVGQKNLTYNVIVPKGFDNCDNPVFDVECRLEWTARPSAADIKIASHKPVAWSISFKNVAGAVPEPASWATMIAGFGLIGSTMRRRRNQLITSSTNYSAS